MTDRSRLPVLLAFLAGFVATFAFLAAASADTGGGLTSDVDDAFSAGRRSGFIFVALGLVVTIVGRVILQRLKPKDGTAPRPGSLRAKLTLAIGGGLATIAAVVDMFATARGLAPVVTAAFGAVTLYYGAKDDPARGSARNDSGGDVPT